MKTILAMFRLVAVLAALVFPQFASAAQPAVEEIEVGFPQGGTASILGVVDAPALQEGRGRLVLSKFTHVAPKVLEITMQGDDGPSLALTPSHQVWSVTHGGWVEVEELRVGHEVQTRGGSTHIIGIEPRAGPERVFDIEVEGEHRYFAGGREVVAHNCPVGIGGGAAEPFAVGRHIDQQGSLPGFDSHHAGQAKGMERLAEKLGVKYDRDAAPTILVPKEGHTIRPPGTPPVLARSYKQFLDDPNARRLLARDIWELRRVYPDIPAPQLRKLIDANKTAFPKLFEKVNK